MRHEIDWTQRFWTDVDFFERETTTPATETADLLTELDLTTLRLVPPQHFIDGEGRHLQQVHRQCNRLCEAIPREHHLCEPAEPDCTPCQGRFHPVVAQIKAN